MKYSIINILKSNKDKFTSGEAISDKLGVTRASIWKYMKALKEEGYLIESAPKKGYKLISSPDLLTYEETKEYLNTKYIGKTIDHFNSLFSSNDKAKEFANMNAKEGTVVVCEKQTSGKGRLGRKWVSPKCKGIWMSIILRPDINTIDVPKITQIAAASVQKTLIDIGVDSYIKWPNDIIVNKKKVCGILTEMSGEINRVNYVIVGIGLNANLDLDDFHSDLSETATSLKIEYQKSFKRNLILANILNNFETLYEDLITENNIEKSIDICRKYSILIGKQVRVINSRKTKKAEALDLNNKGQLIVKFEDGTISPIVSGEISIRGLNGYV